MNIETFFADYGLIFFVVCFAIFLFLWFGVRKAVNKTKLPPLPPGKRGALTQKEKEAYLKETKGQPRINPKKATHYKKLTNDDRFENIKKTYLKNPEQTNSIKNPENIKKNPINNSKQKITKTIETTVTEPEEPTLDDLVKRKVLQTVEKAVTEVHIEASRTKQGNIKIGTVEAKIDHTPVDTTKIFPETTDPKLNSHSKTLRRSKP